jgi:hypothetical protein
MSLKTKDLMKNKPYYHVKPKDEELNNFLAMERNLNTEFYARMSGQKPWMDGEREDFERRFANYSARIHELQGTAAVKWFAGLPQD